MHILEHASVLIKVTFNLSGLACNRAIVLFNIYSSLGYRKFNFRRNQYSEQVITIKLLHTHADKTN